MEQKIIGPRPPLQPGHVWSIRAKLHLERQLRDLALFNLAIDSKLRGCDLIALRVSDVARPWLRLSISCARAWKRRRRKGCRCASGHRQRPGLFTLSILAAHEVGELDSSQVDDIHPHVMTFSQGPHVIFPFVQTAWSRARPKQPEPVLK